MRTWTTIAIGFALGAALGLGVLMTRSAPDGSAPSLSTGKALVGGPFTLTDHTGRRVSDRDWRGRHLLVAFGFTHCPDICPSTLQVISRALEQLGPKAERIVPLFITLDPERDTPELLARYLTAFHPRIVGLTGSPQQIDAVAKAYKVFYKKVTVENSTTEYTIDHSAITFLMDRDGQYVLHFPHGARIDSMVERLGRAL